MPDERCSAAREPGRPEPRAPPAGRLAERARGGSLAVEARNGGPGGLPDPDPVRDGDACAVLVLGGEGFGAGRTVGRAGVVVAGGGGELTTGGFGSTLTVGAGSTLTWGAGEVSTVTGTGGSGGRTFSGSEGIGTTGSGGSSSASAAVAGMRPPTSIAPTSVKRTTRRARLRGAAPAGSKLGP